MLRRIMTRGVAGQRWQIGRTQQAQLWKTPNMNCAMVEKPPRARLSGNRNCCSNQLNSNRKIGEGWVVRAQKLPEQLARQPDLHTVLASPAPGCRDWERLESRGTHQRYLGPSMAVRSTSSVERKRYLDSARATTWPSCWRRWKTSSTESTGKPQVVSRALRPESMRRWRVPGIRRRYGISGHSTGNPPISVAICSLQLKLAYPYCRKKAYTANIVILSGLIQRAVLHTQRSIPWTIPTSSVIRSREEISEKDYRFILQRQIRHEISVDERNSLHKTRLQQLRVNVSAIR